MFEKGTVEPGVVRNDQVQALHQFGYAGIVDALAGHHVVGNPMHRCRGRRDGYARVFQLIENFQYPVDPSAVPAVFEHHHRKFDDGVHLQAQAGGLGIDHRTARERPAVRLAIAAAFGQATQYAVSGMAFEAFGQLLGIAGTEGFLF